MPRSVFSEPYEAFTQALVAARKSAGLTQDQLADRLHKQQSFVSKMERGERRLDVVEFLIIARAIGADPKMMIDQLTGLIPENVRI